MIHRLRASLPHTGIVRTMSTTGGHLKAAAASSNPFPPPSPSAATAAAEAEAPPLLIQKNGHVQTITLNRPKALNSLNVDMCRQLRNLLIQWNQQQTGADKDVGAIILKGSGNKAFCAGGDVKSIWNALTDTPGEDVGTGKPGRLYADFFRVEYQMNYLLGTSKIPQVSLWDGIVMGGGVGVSVLGDFRVATEKTMFAMPETAIGLFPDVGSSGWLPHLKDGFGLYIGLSGCRLKAPDLIHSGVATHYVPSARLEALEAEIAAIATGDASKSRKSIKTILKSYDASSELDMSTSVLAQNEAAITKCFGHTSVENVEQTFANLKAEADAGNAWAARTAETIAKFSPSSLKLTFEQLRRGKDLDLKACLQMEYRMVAACMRAPDFREGVRALLVDKDQHPLWNPSKLEDVHPETIQAYFKSLGGNDLQLSFDDEP